MTHDELLARYYLARTLFWRYELEQLDAAAIADILKALKAANADLRAEIEQALPALWDVYKNSPEGRERLAMLVAEVIAPTAQGIADKVSSAWTYAAQQSLLTYNDILSLGGAAVAVQQVAATADAVKGLASKADFGGRLLSSWVYQAFDDGVVGSIIDSLDKSLAAGHGIAKAAKHVMHTAIDEGFVITQRNCVTITRSYIQQASVNAQLAVYEANKELIKGLKWCAVLDSRTCPLCAPLDGRVYLWGQPRPPMRRHERCRCLWLPVVKTWRELGIDADEMEEIARPWAVREDGPVGAGGKKILYAGTTKENFGGWWKTLPEREQIKSVGVVRTRLLNAGKLSWDDLVDKGTGRYYTLQELGFDLRGNKLQSKVYLTAVSGGKHEGFLKRLERSGPIQAKKAVRSLEKIIKEHEQKIANPAAIYDDWQDMKPERKARVLKHWETEIEGWKEQIEIAHEHLNRKERSK